MGSHFHKDIWNDQAEFDSHLRPEPTTYEERTALTKEFILHLISECDELLRCSGSWKPHRKYDVLENRPQIRNELTDIRKYWIMICQTWGFTAEEMDADYWRKSMVVRQRYSQEWIQRLDRPSIIVDIDNVLADYIGGFADWIEKTLNAKGLADRIRTERPYLTHETTSMSPSAWGSVKHAFRVSGAKASLPLMPWAKEFLEWARSREFQIVLLTARPIIQYPNIYADTLEWLHRNSLPFDFIYWAEKKFDFMGTTTGLDHVQFVVDDMYENLKPFEQYNIRTHLIDRRTTLKDVQTFEENLWQTTRTKGTDHTLDTMEKLPETTSPKPPTT